MILTNKCYKATGMCRTKGIVHGMVCKIFRNHLLKSRLATSPKDLPEVMEELIREIKLYTRNP